MWGWVWTLLALGALVFLAWVAWRVVRAGLELLREAGRAGQVWADASQRLSEVLARAEQERRPVTATMFDDRAELHARVAGLRHERWQRRGRRRAVQAVRWREWAATTWLERRRADRSRTP
ncbi:hypothetical protein ACNHYB_02830 [Isoptericola jiangsuensis]|uniref:hypothetical protein n=1 Tax=Isoptericola jiangsuensis TaxID=548579 RepID=UPI003AAE3F11